MTNEPVILGVRHHSPACARLVCERIRDLKPAYVLIEGPADFNSRLDELALAHRLPIAIYSYLSGTLAEDSDETCAGRQDAPIHRGSWTPFAAHSPEWQAFSTGRAEGAVTRFIDLPAWHSAFANRINRYADDEETQGLTASSYLEGLLERLCIENTDALWDHLFEDYVDLDALAANLHIHFQNLRHEDRGSLGNQDREAMMAQWIGWAMAQQRGVVLVVCGGYHAPALANLWRAQAQRFSPQDAEPCTPVPQVSSEALNLHTNPQSQGAQSPSPAQLRYGSFLVPYTYKRLDSLAGYASGMPSPAYYQWVWNVGPAGASRTVLQAVFRRLRDKKMPASTADLMAVEARAQGLARVRGHSQPLRSDWLDALAGALVKGALDTPLPWSYRGPIRPGTDPILVHIMDVLAGDHIGVLAADTPQPPLVHTFWTELQGAGIQVTALPKAKILNLLTAEGRKASQLLHRTWLLEVPGFQRTGGPQLALSGESKEVWTLSQPYDQPAALIEAGAWGATLADAARAKLEHRLRQSGGRITDLALGLNAAAFAGLHGLSQAVLRDLQTLVAQEPHFEALAQAMGTLLSLLRHGQVLGMAGAPILKAVIEAGVDRALWLLEPPTAIPAAQMLAHIQSFSALKQIALDLVRTPPPQGDLSNSTKAEQGPQGVQQPSLAIALPRLLAVMQRKATNTASAPVSRGAALGLLISISGNLDTDDSTRAFDPMLMLNNLAAAQLGDAVSGLLALARDELIHNLPFVTGLNARLQHLDDADFVIALPALRSAFAWLPTRERSHLAEQVLKLYNSQHLSSRHLTVQTGPWEAEQIANNQLNEQAAIAQLAKWGVTW